MRAAKLFAGRGVAWPVDGSVKRAGTEEPDEGNPHVRIWVAADKAAIPAGESPAVSIARLRHVAMPQFVTGNFTFIAWCKRPGRPEYSEIQRWEQPGGLASMGA